MFLTDSCLTPYSMSFIFCCKILLYFTLQSLTRPAGRQSEQRQLLHRLPGEDGGRVPFLVQQLSLRLAAGSVPEVKAADNMKENGTLPVERDAVCGGPDPPISSPLSTSVHFCEFTIISSRLLFMNSSEVGGGGND